ncbi:hypothetical protein [Cellulosimicrobium sp. NPDC055967]|uniref:hypothetical protein n=1 Tax=Cellulosimicrobium sp. NPDC055967 TaxID=3345670 RepID=UPI0035E02187
MNADDSRAAATYLGIQDYRPAFQRGVEAIAAAHGPQLLDLPGRTLVRTWLCCARDDEEWVADAPVVLQFDGVQLEILHNKFDELSLTRGRIDVVRPIDFPDGDWRWSDDSNERLSALRGRVVVDVELLEWLGRDMAYGSLAIGLLFESGDRLTIYNALDENGLTFDAPLAEYRAYRLAD